MQPVSNAGSGPAGEHAIALDGLQPQSWGGLVLAGKPLFTSGGIIESAVLYPAQEGQPPEEAFIIALDLGKRAIKGGGVDRFGRFRQTVLVDAYSAARRVQQEEGDDVGDAIWRVFAKEQVSENFKCGTGALRTADALPVNETVVERLRDSRVLNMMLAALIQSLIANGVDATMYNEDKPVIAKRNIILTLGLPVSDLTKRGEATHKVLEGLKGLYTIEQYQPATGDTLTWLIDIIGIIPTPQPRGTHYTATRNLNGTAAIQQKIVTIIDIGGGDIYAYEVDSSSGIVVEGTRLGDGTISIARELISAVDDAYGFEISEAQAQEALHTHHVLLGGEERDITTILDSLKPRFANLLTTVTISRRMRSTFIVFTGGGVALLHDEIRTKMQGQPGKQEEGVDYLIMPVAIAPLANCIGLFAHGYYKVQQVIRKVVLSYLDLLDRRRELLEHLGQPRQDEALAAAQAELTALQARMDKHVGQHYKLFQHQILLERQGAAARAAQ